MERLTEAQITEKMENVPKWKRLENDQWIGRKYTFKQYLSGIRYVDQIAAYAESMNHHPFISIDYKKILVKISSWQAKGLTDLDIEMAQHFDELYENAEQ